MRKYTITILFVVLTLILVSCKASPDPQTVDAPDVQTAETEVSAPVVQDNTGGELSWIFDEPANPVDVAVKLETEGTVQALIPLEGGLITATGADGTIFTLEIPTDALLSETLIGLTPVSSISNMPFGSEQTYAVQLSPDGLVLQNYAILTITPVTEIPINEQLVFGYQADGADLILAAPVVDSNEIKINVLHFSGNGATRGYWGDIEPERQRLGGDIEKRLLNAVNEALIRQRQEGKDGDGESLRDLFREAFSQYVEEVVKPRVAAAGESCANGRLALETVNSFERTAALLGFLPGEFLEIDMAALLEKATRACMLEEFEICVEEHIIYRILVVWDAFVQQYAILGIPEGAALREARDLAIACLTFRLEFESTGRYDIEDGGMVSSVTSELILRYNPEKGFILGAVAELVNTEFEFYSSFCDVTSIPGGGVFATLGMSYELEPDANGILSDIGVSDIKLTYMPGNTSESGTVNCPDSAPFPLLTTALWTAAFMDTHHDELDIGSFQAVDWEMVGGDLFAEKEWSKTSGSTAGVSEVGSFKLYHAPGE